MSRSYTKMECLAEDKYNLRSVVRRRRPYMHYRRAIHKYPNLLNRQFEQLQPNHFGVTDITYIPTAKGMVYMCAVVDLCGKTVLSYRLGNDMTPHSAVNVKSWLSV